MPGTFVSKLGCTSGTVTRFTAWPAFMEIAPTGQPFTQSPWPLHSASSTTASLPRIVMAPGSGHSATQVPQPTHMSARTSARMGPVFAPATAGADVGALTTSKIWSGTPQAAQKVEPAATVA